MWEKADLEERHTILKGFLECVYVDLAEPTTLVGIKPKPQFLEFLGQAGSESRAPDKGENEGSDAEIASEPVLTGWWRRGRVERYRTPYLRNPASATDLVGVELLAA